MSSFFVYLIGSILVAAGLAYGAYAMGLAQTWIIVIALVVVGFGIMGGIQKTQRKQDPE